MGCKGYLNESSNCKTYIYIYIYIYRYVYLCVYIYVYILFVMLVRFAIAVPSIAVGSYKSNRSTKVSWVLNAMSVGSRPIGVLFDVHCTMNNHVINKVSITTHRSTSHRTRQHIWQSTNTRIASIRKFQTSLESTREVGDSLTALPSVTSCLDEWMNGQPVSSNTHISYKT